MGGKASRDKGSRGELIVRDYMIALGYTAYRVPLSGASQGFKGDVVATKDGKTLVLEVKFRKDEYKSIYALIDSFDDNSDIGLQGEKGELVTLGYSIESVLIQNYYHNYNVLDVNPKALRKLVGLKKLLGTADILVLKINNKPLLFVKYA
jgi:Holliday junction resolvase